MVSIALVFVIIAIGVVAYRLGKSVGYEDGFLDGHRVATAKWQPSGSVRVLPPQG